MKRWHRRHKEDIRRAMEAEPVKMTALEFHTCARCRESRSQLDLAKIGDEWYCHGAWDGHPTCYMKESWGE